MALKAILARANGRDGTYAAPEEIFQRIAADIEACKDDDSRVEAASLLFDKSNGIFPVLEKHRDGESRSPPPPPEGDDGLQS